MGGGVGVGEGVRRNDGWLWVSATPWISSPAPFPLCLSPSVLHSPHVSPPPISLPHSLYLPLLPSLCCLLREAASVCFSLSRFLIRRQWKRGRGTGRTIRGEFIRVAQSVITPVPLSPPPATTSLPCHRATDCSPYRSTHTHTHTAHLWVCLRMSVQQLCWCALP